LSTIVHTGDAGRSVNVPENGVVHILPIRFLGVVGNFKGEGNGGTLHPRFNTVFGNHLPFPPKDLLVDASILAGAADGAVDARQLERETFLGQESRAGLEESFQVTTDHPRQCFQFQNGSAKLLPAQGGPDGPDQKTGSDQRKKEAQECRVVPVLEDFSSFGGFLEATPSRT